MDASKRQRKLDVEHERQPIDLATRLETPEGRVVGHPEKLQDGPARLQAKFL
jgi:hypothetical protein